MHIDYVKLSKDRPTIGEGGQIKDTKFGHYVEIGSQNFIDNSTIDDYTYTGQLCFIQNSELKRFISMAAMVRIGPTNHPYNRPSQHIFAYNGVGYGFGDPDTAFLQQRRELKTVIGNDVWLGHDVVVQAGVTVGDGAVVGAGAVVTKDVEPYTIVGVFRAKRSRTDSRMKLRRIWLRLLGGIGRGKNWKQTTPILDYRLKNLLLSIYSRIIRGSTVVVIMVEPFLMGK